ncbi:SiaB family protein kinase [Glaciimonas sp. PCH181]|uniref:SiaB family protein kinase n=1 Tax=Glaciimonas sp. PCH181 TaxID=2133943 RepID=UPI000D3D658F|nr:SiaB family protein kinase [Glaciimonas sp. PCH181]PUA17786.1 hypothetical protein C7W93_18155 [Glaciimonas sp. PCH181]
MTDIPYKEFCEIATKRNVIFYYGGYFSQNIISAMADAVKMRIQHVGAAGQTRRKLFSSFVEMAQNIIHYSSDSVDPAGQTDSQIRHGSVCICTKGDKFFLHCANPIKTEVADRLHEKLVQLRTMTMDEIKTAYKEMLRADTPEDSKGAGLGLLTVARDASEPLEFEFCPTAQLGNTMFYLKATI